MGEDEEQKARAADAPRGVEVSRITIVKVFDDESEGGMSVWTTYSGGLTLLDAVGMLAFAASVVYRDYGNMEDEDD